MTPVRREMSASPAEVWRVLADGWLYTGWVVGASHIRAVDARWPDVGQQLHHSVGAWPFLISDSTTTLEAEPPHRLVLQARAWPAGEARIELTITGDDLTSTVTIDEVPNKGPGKWLHNPVQDRLLVARNREALDRLAALAEGRAAD